MNRVDLIELMPLGVISPYSSISTSRRSETKIQRNGFSIIERPLRVKIALERPEVIYTDDFASQISAYLLNGKTVEVNCGVDSKKAVFICQELISGGALEKIKKQDGQEVKTQTYTERFKKGFFDFFGKKHLIVTFRKAENQEQIQEEFAFASLAQTSEVYDKQDQRLDEEEVDHFLASYGRYTNASTLKVEGPIQDYFQEMEDLMNGHGIVEIRRKDLQGNLEFLGLFVEKEPESKEIKINLNGQDESHFEEIFAPLVRYFVQKGETVLVDHDALDPYELENKICESPVYNSFVSKLQEKLE